MENYMMWVWFVILIMALVGEVLTKKKVVVAFGIGAMPAIIFALIEGIPYYVEIIIFSIVSIIFLILLRPSVYKYFNNYKLPKDFSKNIGQVVTAKTSFDGVNKGLILFNNEYYKAKLNDDSNESVKKDELVKIVKIEGNLVIVKKVSNGEIA